MMSLFVSYGAVAFFLAFFATMIVRYFAIRLDILDRPREQKHVHTRPMPRMGGLAIYVSVSVCVFVSLFSSDWLTSGTIAQNHYLVVLVGGLILMIGGILDDKFDLPPAATFVAPVLAALLVTAGGINIEKLTNPFGGVILVHPWESNILVFVWLMVVMYTTKFLDGLDGLSTSVSSVGVFMVLLLSLTTQYFQPDVGLLSTIILGAMLGFLFWNAPPASIFLGEGGSTLVGYLLGILAVISGGKLATALLVLAIPLLDVVWIIVRRFRSGGIKRIFVGDRKHLHHRLFDRGWKQPHIVLFYVFVAGVSGVSALFLQSKEKLVVLVLVSGLMAVGAFFLVTRDKQRRA